MKYEFIYCIYIYTHLHIKYIYTLYIYRERERKNGINSINEIDGDGDGHGDGHGDFNWGSHFLVEDPTEKVTVSVGSSGDGEKPAELMDLETKAFTFQGFQ
jgi:hypothetical protein